MGRLNYTNRKIEGVKLGQVVAKDLTKRIPPALGSKAALRDPVVEIDLRSKQLTDAGFQELSEGLTNSLHNKGPQGTIVLLEELCLKANRLTILSLENLTPIIRLVANDLRDLDLSDNLISVNDPDDVMSWEAFLVSLSQCCVLRRLDLSGNDLGTKGFEVLARVYARERPIDALCLEEPEFPKQSPAAHITTALEHVNIHSNIANHPESDEVDSTEEKRPRHKSKKDKPPRNGTKALEKSNHSSPEKHDHSVGRSENLRTYSQTKGLHSIPYIILADTCMSDAGALYLSYAVVDHHCPSHLLTRVPPAKPGPEQQQLDAYDETQCHGIIYNPNTKLTKKGIKILSLAEEERTRLSQRSPSNEGEQTLDPLIKADEMPEHSRMMLGLNNHLNPSAHQRRTSGSINGHTGLFGTQPKLMNELDRARSRVQGEELEKTGQYGNDLWRTAMNMLCLCREIQLPSPEETLQTNQYPHGPQLDVLPGDDFPLLPPATVPQPKKPIVKTLDVPGYPMQKTKAAAPLLPLGNGNPNQTILPRSHYLRKSSVTEIPNPPWVTSTAPQSKSSESKFLEVVNRTKAKEYRSKLPCGFSKGIWWQILGQAVGAHGMLSQDQQKSVLSWAMDRNTLKREREWLVEKEGNQIWHVLDGMRCLAYEFDEETEWATPDDA